MNKDLNKLYQKYYEKRRLEVLNYNKKLHLELLDQHQEGDDYQPKLTSYFIILIDQLHWETRDQYLELITNYLQGKISSFDFRMKFRKRYHSMEKLARLFQLNRVLLSPHKSSSDFGSFLGIVDSYCEAYYDDPYSDPSWFEIGEADFRILIEQKYSNIQNLLNKEEMKKDTLIMEPSLEREEISIALVQKLRNLKGSFVTENLLAELESYKIFLFDFFVWNYRHLYWKLLLDLLDCKISCDDFSNQLCTIRVNHIREFDQLMKKLQFMNQLELNSKFFNKLNLDINAFEFGDFIDRLYECSDRLVSNKLLEEIGGEREKGEVDDNQFRELVEQVSVEFLESRPIFETPKDKSSNLRKLIEDVFVKLQDEEKLEKFDSFGSNTNTNDREILQFVIIFFILMILLACSVLNPVLFHLVWLVR